MIRLLNTVTGEFHTFDGHLDTRYAILSHVWDRDGEQSYQDVRAIQQAVFPTGGAGSILVWICRIVWLYLLLHLTLICKYLPIFITITSMPLHSRHKAHLVEYLAEWGETFEAAGGDTRLRAFNILYGTQLSAKIRGACAAARADGLLFIWIDSCCIDKTSSSEVSEAINTMYQWYRDAAICFAFLADVPMPTPSCPVTAQDSPFRRSKWFTRGWTLQELLAPEMVLFLSASWSPLGTKRTLALTIAGISGIRPDLLVDFLPLSRVCVAERMSWAARRETTKVEDMAYALMGIFSISMPILYGEGSRAFFRLQQEIVRQIPDRSIFAWAPFQLFRLGEHLDQEPYAYYRYGHRIGRSMMWQSGPRYSTFREQTPGQLFAGSPRDFLHGASIRSISHQMFMQRLGIDIPFPEVVVSSYGVCTSFPLLPLSCYTESPPSPTQAIFEGPFDSNARNAERWYLALLPCEVTFTNSAFHDGGELLAFPVCCRHGSSETGFEEDVLCVDTKATKQMLGGFLTYTPVSSPESYFRARMLVMQTPFLARWGQHIRMENGYFPQPDNQRAFKKLDSGGTYREAAMKHAHGLIPANSVRLEPWCMDVLVRQGYRLEHRSEERWGKLDSCDSEVQQVVGILDVHKPSLHLRIEYAAWPHGPDHESIGSDSRCVVISVTALEDSKWRSPFREVLRACGGSGVIEKYGLSSGEVMRFSTSLSWANDPSTWTTGRQWNLRIEVYPSNAIAAQCLPSVTA